MLIAPRERRWPVAVALAVLAGAGGGAWLYFDRDIPPPDRAGGPRQIQPQPPIKFYGLPHLSAEVRNLEFKTDVLRGNGLAVTAWLEQIRAAAPNAVRVQPANLLETVPPLMLCDYDGDPALSLDEALDLLRFAGISMSRAHDGVFDVAWADASAQASEYLKSSTSPDSLAWGVFRPWRALSVRLDGNVAVGASISVSGARALAWMLQGRRLNLENSRDGPMKSLRTDALDSAEMDVASRMARQLFTRSEFIPEIAVGLGAAASLFKADDLRTANMLWKDLDESKPVVAAAWAWALGQSSSGEAVQRLTATVETVHDPKVLTAALAALCHTEKIGRQLTVAELGKEGWAWRDVAYKRLRVWLARPENIKLAKNETPLDLSRAYVQLAEAFGVSDADAVRAHRDRLNIQRPPDLAKLDCAGPAWRRSVLTPPAAAELLRSNERRSALAALWRWNRPGADQPTPPQMENEAAMLALFMENILQRAPSATLRRLALEALYREGDRRAGARQPALLENCGPALASFQRDSDAGVRLAAASVLSRLAGVPELEILRTLSAARPPAGMDLVLQGAVQRFWHGADVTDEQTAVLKDLIDALLASADLQLSARAAWAKMQDPTVNFETKLRLAHDFKLPAQRVSALEGLRNLREPSPLSARIAMSFQRDADASVRAAVVTSDLLDRVSPAIERLKCYLHGLDDSHAAVRLAVLNARSASTPANREGLREHVRQIAGRDEVEAVRQAALGWLHRNGLAE